jgi:hypothetical protein
LGGVARFAGISLDRETAATVASDRSFERMRAAEASGELGERFGEILRPGDPTDPESFKVRRGWVGGYPEYLSRGDLAYCEEVLRGSDYWPSLQAAMARWSVERIGDAAGGSVSTQIAA